MMREREREIHDDVCVCMGSMQDFYGRNEMKEEEINKFLWLLHFKRNNYCNKLMLIKVSNIELR